MPQVDVVDVAELSEGGKRRAHRGAWIVAAVVVLAAIVVVAVLVMRGGHNKKDAQTNLAARQAEVERRGAAVMPFDQNLTMHQFTETASGGVETITANNPKDTNQIMLVQEHLAHERDLFAAGNFSDPMAIHGMAMPGIQDLQHGAAAGRVTITYTAMANGARLTYTTTDPVLIYALHTWFEAQLMDHGSHAMG